jgi:2-phospho-L-lactate/phosphoenolpyruvate guanylyltransferase
MRTDVVVLVPVKSLDLGKSRLLGITDTERRMLAAAFALDTISAARSTPGVSGVAVVTDDAEMAERARLAGCSALPDAGDLNGSLRAAAAGVAVQRPRVLVVALCADLPALTGEELRLALDEVDGVVPWFVRDHRGTGTTMYAAPPDRFDPRFGAVSRAAHLLAGAHEVMAAVPGLRRDVDTIDDLEHLASEDALGAHTRRALTTNAPLP